MPPTAEYSEILLQIEALNSDQSSGTTIPVHVLVQEADDLYLWCQDDQEQLIQAGLNWQRVTLIPVCAGICREFQSQWVKNHKSVDQDKLEWKTKSSEALKLRNELQHDFRYAFRKNEVLLAKVSDISKEQSRASFVQCLNDLAVLGRDHIGLLETINFNAEKLETATLLAPQMADLIARINRNNKESNKSKTTRDQSYSYLKQLIDEIRECGKYKFRENPERLAGYLSDYWKRINSTRAKKASNNDTSQTDSK